MSAEPKWTINRQDLGTTPVLRVVLVGHFRVDDWLAVLQELPRADGFVPGIGAIFDAVGATFNFSEHGVRRVVANVEGHFERRGDVRFRSVFVTPDDLEFGVTRMILSLCEQYPADFAVFRSIEAAEDWLAT